MQTAPFIMQTASAVLHPAERKTLTYGCSADTEPEYVTLKTGGAAVTTRVFHNLPQFVIFKISPMADSFLPSFLPSFTLNEK